MTKFFKKWIKTGPDPVCFVNSDPQARIQVGQYSQDIYCTPLPPKNLFRIKFLTCPRF